MPSPYLYEIINFVDTEEFLKKWTGPPIFLSNRPGSSRLYGSLTINYIFCYLKETYPSKIEKIIFNAGNDLTSLFTAIELGYKNIIFAGEIS